jgi:hypothetical protein
MTFQTISPGRHHEAALPDFGENHDPGGQQNHALDITAIRELFVTRRASSAGIF